MSRTFVILTHVRSGSSMLADMLAHNGLGAAEEHLNLRYLGEGGDWRPADVLAKAKTESPGEYFGSKVMVHWLDGLKKHAEMRSATDPQLLASLFGPDCTMIHLYRDDSVAAAISFTRAKMGGQWHRKTGESVRKAPLPRWEVLQHLISENVTWMDWCKHRLRRVASMWSPGAVEMCYEDLEADTAGELQRVMVAIAGEQAATSRELKVITKLVKQRDSESDELRARWLAEHQFYGSYERP